MTSRSPVESSELDSSYTTVEFQASRIEKIPSSYISHSLRVDLDRAYGSTFAD